MVEWLVERLIHFDFNVDFVKDGLAHFGFHMQDGQYFALEHQRHLMAQVGNGGQIEWTAAKNPVFPGVANIQVPLNAPIFVDKSVDGSLVVSNFGDSRLYRIYPDVMKAELIVDGAALGIKHAGNCVIDRDDCIWLNEVEGCRIRRFDPTGALILTLGTGKPGFQSRPVSFDDAMFNWVYDMRRGPDGNVYVLDSKNFAVRVIDVGEGKVLTIAGTGKAGYGGDGGDPLLASFGGNAGAKFDGPISMSLDTNGDIYVGDRFNRVVRAINRRSDEIKTIAGDTRFTGKGRNDPLTRDPLALKLPEISSMDFHRGHLFVPTDLDNDSGDLAVLAKAT